MTQLVFFLEEPSAKEMLKGILPRIISENVLVKYVVFQGKQDLEKRLPIRLRAWQYPNAKFVVMRDKDNGDCIKIKNALREKCVQSGKPNTLIRIACHELESFYLGDLLAVQDSIGPNNISQLQYKAKYRNPDVLANASQELKKISPDYQKVSGSRAIGVLLNIENNTSNSFNSLIAGIKNLI